MVFDGKSFFFGGDFIMNDMVLVELLFFLFFIILGVYVFFLCKGVVWFVLVFVFLVFFIEWSDIGVFIF